MRTFQPSVYSFAGDFGTTIPPVPGTAVSPVPEGAVAPKKGKKKKRRPLWVLPTIVGSSILVVGGLATFLLYRSKKKKASAAVPAPATV